MRRRIRLLRLLARLLRVPLAAISPPPPPVVYGIHDAKVERAIADMVNRASVRGLIR